MSEQPKTFQRFSPIQRFEHFLLVVGFLGLVLTGLPQKYADHDWARTWINLLDGIESTRTLHRSFAILLLATVIFHLLSIGFKLWVLGKSASLIPTRQDFRDGWDWLRFNVGLKADRPRMPFYNFSEKLDYWLVVTGILVLILTGLILWNPIFASKLVSGEIIPTARIAHGGEAVFLLLVVGWHLYNVFIKQFNRSMMTGQLSQRQMEQEHAAVLENAISPEGFSSQKIAQRRQQFYPIAAVFTLLLVAGGYYFLSFEDTAITTVPRQDAPFLALDPALQVGDAQVGQDLWGTERCARCHGIDAAGMGEAPALMGTPLTFEQFLLQVRTGGEEMPAFSHLELSDSYVLHLWAWLTSEQ